MLRRDFWTGLISRRLCRFLFLFQLALLYSVPHFFVLYWSLSSSLCTIFDTTSFNIDEVLSINPSADLLFLPLETNAHHKDLLTCSSETDGPGKLCNNFSISNNLIQMVNFLALIPEVWFSQSCLLDLILSSDASICFTMAFPPLEDSDHVAASVSINFLPNSKEHVPFHHRVYDYSWTDWDGLHDHMRDIPWEDIFKLNASFFFLFDWVEWISMKSWTATTRYDVTRKRSTKRLKHTGNVFRKNHS